MDNVCEKCGKTLAEGQACDCQNQRQTVSQSNVNTATFNSNNIMGEIKGVFGNIMNIYKNPEKITKKGNSIITPIVTLVLQTIAIFLVIMISINRIISSITKGLGSYYSKSEFKIPGDVYVKVFFATLLVCAAFYAVFTLVTYLVFGTWKKEKITFKESLSKFAYVMLPVTLIVILAWLGSYIHAYVVYAIVVYGMAHYYLFINRYYKDNFNVSENTLSLLTPLVIMVTAVVGYFLMGKIIGAFMPSEMSGILNPFSSMSSMFDIF